MPSSTSSASLEEPLQSSVLINNQSNNGLIGDGSYNFVTSGNNNQINITQVGTAEEDVELDSLLDRYVSNGALRTSFYSPPECHPGTRTTILNEIGGWIDESGSDGSPLLWLNGPAGVGKSVIAKTISGYHDQVVATFFFSTSIDRSAATIFPTLAWQLARRIPETRRHIIAALKNSDSLQTSQLEEQFNLLIVQPLKKITITLKYRPVMVVDGVDECTDESMLARFLRALVQAGERGNMPIRFIICSRPEPWIHAILRRIPVLSNVNPTTNGQPQSSGVESMTPRLVFVILVVLVALIALTALIWLIVSIALAIASPALAQLTRLITSITSMQLIPFIASIASIASIALIALIASVALTLLFTLIVLIAIIVLSDAIETPITLIAATITRLITFIPPFPSYSPRFEARLPSPIRGGFLQDIQELYRPIRLGVDKNTPPFLSSSSDQPADTLDKIVRHSVITTIQIGFSQECKEDISRYLTDKFDAIGQPEDGTSPWFEPCDISDIVEASCGQFLYASTIARLLGECYFDRREVLNMARRSSLPTPDLNKLYKAILTRAEITIRNQAQEGGPNHKRELRFLMDSLALLVFFAGNSRFFTVRKSFSVIETLLGLERGKLTLKLRKMHSVLRIVPGETVQIHHLSFLEFLQNRERSGEYYISYSNALRRILILMTRAWLRHLCRQSE